MTWYRELRAIDAAACHVMSSAPPNQEAMAHGGH